MKKTRSRRVNISIEICFKRFREELERNLKRALEKALNNEKEIYMNIYIDSIDEARVTLNSELFGMHLIGGMDYKEYKLLKIKINRITEEYIKAVKNC
jgi:vacuolar-type H+-ATPase subunit E/Vma4